MGVRSSSFTSSFVTTVGAEVWEWAWVRGVGTDRAVAAGFWDLIAGRGVENMFWRTEDCRDVLTDKDSGAL